MLELKTIVAIAATKKQKTVDFLMALPLYLFIKMVIKLMYRLQQPCPNRTVP